MKYLIQKTHYIMDDEWELTDDPAYALRQLLWVGRKLFRIDKITELSTIKIEDVEKIHNTPEET